MDRWRAYLNMRMFIGRIAVSVENYKYYNLGSASWMSHKRARALLIVCTFIVTLFSNLHTYASEQTAPDMDVTGATTVTTGKFAPVATTYTITINSFPGGSTLPSGSATVLAGGTLYIYIMPDSGWEIGTITVDNLSVGPMASYVFSNVKANHVFAVTFKAKPPIPSPGIQRP